MFSLIPVFLEKNLDASWWVVRVVIRANEGKDLKKKIIWILKKKWVFFTIQIEPPPFKKPLSECSWEVFLRVFED